MTDAELLVQRFLDQELSADERVAFVARLGRDDAMRRRTIELERLMIEAGRLPRPMVPDGFVERVLAAALPDRSWWRRTVDAIWMPRLMHWNLGGALAAAGAVLLALSASALLWQQSAATTVAPSGSEAAPASTAVLVRLVVLQPGARSVHVAGDFNGWDPDRTPLEQISSGAWMTTVSLEPGRYEYMFVVDGSTWIADPFAAEQSDDGFGARNAVLEVRPPQASSL
jgi:hypothetical protein